MNTKARSISDLSNQTTSDVIGDIFAVRGLMNDLVTRKILIEDPFISDVIVDPRNAYGFEKLLEIFCRLGVFRAGQLAEIYTCMSTGDSLASKNNAGTDTVGGIETKSTKSLQQSSSGTYYFRVGNLRGKDLSKVHVVITYGGILQEAVLDLRNHFGDTLTIPADKDGVVKRSSTWGAFFYKD
jgi:hypothetical protein